MNPKQEAVLQALDKYVEAYDVPGHDPVLIGCTRSGTWWCWLDVRWTWDGPEHEGAVGTGATLIEAVARALAAASEEAV